MPNIILAIHGQSDWKKLLNELVPKAEDESKENVPEKGSVSKSENDLIKRQDLIIRFERRNGKPATIVSNYQGTEKELKELAKELKIHCGTGGSAKDDEILIQGDVRQKVALLLRSIGFKVRGSI